MRTTTILAVGAAMAAIPAAPALGATSDTAPSPTGLAPHLSLAGHFSVGAQMRAAQRRDVQVRLTRRVVRLARRVAHVRGERFDARRYRARLRGDSPEQLRKRLRALRRARRRAERVAVSTPAAAPSAAAATSSSGAPPSRAGGSGASPTLEAIAACESGGNAGASTGNGFYGKYQFTTSTWASVGGTGNPAQASEAEQDKRAALLYARTGGSSWPVCGR